MSRRSAAELAAAAGYATLAVLVAAGSATGLDQWAIDHAMPFAHTGANRKPTMLEALVPLLHASFGSTSAVVADVVTVPASFLLSLAIVAACRRWSYLVLWAAANAVEELCKTALTRPPLTRHGVHLVAYDNSYPSGHTLRTVIVAAAVAAAFPALRAWAWLWAIASLALIELAGYHVPADIAGGLLLVALLLSLRTRWSSWRPASWPSRRRSSRASRPSARAH